VRSVVESAFLLLLGVLAPLTLTLIGWTPPSASTVRRSRPPDPPARPT